MEAVRIHIFTAVAAMLGATQLNDADEVYALPHSSVSAPVTKDRILTFP